LGRDHGKAPVANQLAGFSVRGEFGEEQRIAHIQLNSRTTYAGSMRKITLILVKSALVSVSFAPSHAVNSVRA